MGDVSMVYSGELGNGPFVFSGAARLVGTPTVFTGECAALVQYYLPILRRELDGRGNPVPGTGTKDWVEGIKVKGNKNKIQKGTAIATFANGKYLGHDTGNHAAFYLDQHPKKGIFVAEQFHGVQHIQGRWLKYLGKNHDGSYNSVSNNGDAFSVIMLPLPSLFMVDSGF